MTEIGLPFAPSTIVKKEVLNMNEITISCGGGMGGSRWEVYTQDQFDLNNKFIKVDTNNNKDSIINTNFIVQIKPVKIVKLSIKNDGNSNMRQKIGTIENYYYLIGQNEEYEIVNRYVNGNEKIKRITFNY